MTIHQTPAPARTDLLPSAIPEPAPADAVIDAVIDATVETHGAGRPYRLHGTMLSVGAVAWALSMVALGGVTTPDEESVAQLLTFGLGSGLFQVGLLFLLRVLWRSQALGSGRVARTFLRLETGLVVMAIASTTVDALGVSDLDQAGWAALDAFWPLSMLGMFGIAIRIAVAGRWKGLARFWPLVAESWALVVIPTMGIVGEGAAGVVAVVHLLVGYAVLGRVVARKVS